MVACRSILVREPCDVTGGWHALLSLTWEGPGLAAMEALLGAQVSLRNNRRPVAAMRSSRLPAIKTLTDFDFSFRPSLKREQIDSLHTLGFLELVVYWTS